MKEEVQIHIPHSVPKEESETSLDNERSEMPWESRQEQYILKIKEKCSDLSKQHDTASKMHKKRYIRYSVPAIILPIVFGTVSNFIPAEYDYVSGVALSVTGILTGINTFFNHARKCERHNEYSGRYAELAGYISTEMCKPKKYRVQLDVYLERVTRKFNDLNNSSPML